MFPFVFVVVVVVTFEKKARNNQFMRVTHSIKKKEKYKKNKKRQTKLNNT